MTDKISYRIGVHMSHCCKWHGCKYGDLSCPVYVGNSLQGYPCEFCEDEPKITIPKEIYDVLVRDSRFLATLELYGVDNWEGWNDVIRMFADEVDNG